MGAVLWSALLGLGLSPQADPPSKVTEAATVAVLPLRIEGELPERWSAEAQAKLAGALARGALEVTTAAGVPSDCDTLACWSDHDALHGVDFVVAASLSVTETRDYALSVDVRSAKTGSVVASTEGTCELCGFEEAIAMIEARTAALSPEVARLAAALPVLVIYSEPAGVTVKIDGTDYGATPLRVQLPAGSHRVWASKAGFLEQSFELEAVDGLRKEVQLRLVEAPSDPRPAGGGLLTAGAVLAGAGLGAVAAGATLLVLDGRPYRRRCEADAAGTCQFDYETTIGGAVGLALGGAAIASGVGMLAAGLVRRKRSQARARVHPSVGGVLVRF